MLIHTNDGHRVYLDTKEPFMTLHLLEHGEWETHVRREIKNELAKSKTFIDVGANIGLHTLYASLQIGKRGKIIALEPHPENRALLCKNLEVNGLLDRVIVLPFLVSNENDSVVPFECFIQHPAMSGMRVSKHHLNPNNGMVKKIQAKTITIDSLVEKYEIVPDLIKVDVEGFEYYVLQGCEKTIAKYENVRFILEYQNEIAEDVICPGIGVEIGKFFKDRGFDVFRIEADHKRSIPYDVFASDAGDYLFSR